jgi:predicted ATPase
MSTVEWLATYVPSLDDVRAALRWAFAPGGDPSMGLALTTATVPLLWLQLSLLGECRVWVEQALAALDADAKGTHHEMLLQAALGLTEEHIKGPVSTVRAVWERVLELAVGLDEIEYQLRAYYGLWLHSMQTRGYRDALGHARDFSRVAEHEMTRTDILTGDRLIGTALVYLGDHADARVHLQRVCDHYVRPPNRSRAVRYGLDQRVGALMHLARNLWFLGFADQAVSTVRAAIAEAGVAEHEMSLCYTLIDAACPISAWIGDLPEVERYGAMLIDLAERRSLGVWRACGMAWQIWASAKHKHADAAAPALADALRTLREVRFFTYYTIYLGWLGETVATAEQIAESLRVTESALRDSNELWCFPEFLRIKGELLLLQNATNAAAAEDDLRQALDLARRQGALSWGLRAAMSLARLQRGQGRTAEALAQLAPVYERFSEGFGTADLRAAKSLIDDLRIGI